MYCNLCRSELKTRMRNLKLLYSVKVGEASELAGTESLCVDCDTENVYSATKTNIIGLSPQSQEVIYFQ